MCVCGLRSELRMKPCTWALGIYILDLSVQFDKCVTCGIYLERGVLTWFDPRGHRLCER